MSGMWKCFLQVYLHLLLLQYEADLQYLSSCWSIGEGGRGGEGRGGGGGKGRGRGRGEEGEGRRGGGEGGGEGGNYLKL